MTWDTAPGDPRHSWEVPKDDSDPTAGVCTTFAEVFRALEWDWQTVVTNLDSAQEILSRYNLPDSLRHELQSFVDNPDVWVDVPDDQRQAVHTWLEQHGSESPD